MAIVNLTSLNDKLLTNIRHAWSAACGIRPDFKPYTSVRYHDRKLLIYDIVERVDDSLEYEDYLTAYKELDIDDLDVKLRSVEHVVPQSKCVDKAATGDPLGWIIADSVMNSKRSNHPLKLWLDESDIENSLMNIDGERHYVPPASQCARLARKWLFVRATYPNIIPPSHAQYKHRDKIIDLVKTYPIQQAERDFNIEFKKQYGWSNPLITNDADRWYSDLEWCNIVFES